jgi:diaminohydroxyphosphoribosylaminopyrimidine deaminase / 5-amino-6-(5-phosphoribosylamino)uracil reductase
MPTDSFTPPDREAMRRALALAEGGRGKVSPNPMVGAVIARGRATLGEGFHERLGGLHAEAAALEDCRRRGEDPRGATAYVSQEPCAHTGRQPPCAPALVEAGISRVVIGSDDPSAHASGAGPRILADAGVEVTWASEPESTDARLLNQPFRKHARTGRPHVTLKGALTLDGRTATRTGDARWISDEESRSLAHSRRAEADAIAVGIGTALADDPLLTARGVEPAPARQPRRVVFDSTARLPLDSSLVGSVGEAPLSVVVGPEAADERVAGLERAGADVIRAPADPVQGVGVALDALGERDITSLILEGGSELAGSFHDAGEIDAIDLYFAPLVVGGADARPLIGGSGAAAIAEATRALDVEWRPSSASDMNLAARLRDW